MSTSKEGKSKAASRDIPVTVSPIDLSGEIDLCDVQAHQAVRDQIRNSTNRIFPVMSESRHSHARVVDSERYSVRSYVPASEGDGYWELYRISSNVVVMIGECFYTQPKWLGTPDQGYFKIRLLWSGRFLTADGNLMLEGPSGMLAIYPGPTKGGFYVAANQRFRAVILHCRISMLLNEIGIVPEESPEPLCYLNDMRRAKPVTKDVVFTPRLVRCISDILDDRDLYAANFRNWFVEAKAKEILTTVLQAQVQEPELELGTNRITNRDRHRILEAQEIIKANLADLPTIAELSKMVGINRTKLKLGFKAMVGSSIGEFAQQQQMEAAAVMLRSSEHQISDISYALGYKHPGNFSQAFRRYYGALPSKMRTRKQNQD